jgi:threonyl-tRNA synthetase
VEVDRGDERLAKQIRNTGQQRVPVMKEMEMNELHVRSRKLGDLSYFGVEDLFEQLL